jgi:hypothetical protein
LALAPKAEEQESVLASVARGILLADGTLVAGGNLIAQGNTGTTVVPVGKYGQLVSIPGGLKIQVSSDGINWQDGPSWVAT